MKIRKTFLFGLLAGMLWACTPEVQNDIQLLSVDLNPSEVPFGARR